jgi:hypothetical protein
VTITKKDNNGVYNPDTGQMDIASSSITGFGAVFPQGDKNIDGTLVKVGDKRLLLSAISMPKPEINSIVEHDGIEYSVQEPVKELKPASVVVMYECNLR